MALDAELVREVPCPNRAQPNAGGTRVGEEEESSVTKTEVVEVEPLDVALDERDLIEIAPAAEITPIARLGRYELLGRMAIGGMAEIYLARERFESLGSRQLVVKVMRLELEGQAEYHTMFLHESQVALRLSHPNICHVYECGIEEGRCFIAMEHVHGVTWRELQKRSALTGTRMPVPVIVKIAAQVAEALHSAHHTKDAAGRPLNVVHRDVSPQNVMIAFDGVVKLLDFGVAHARTERAFERSGTIQGKFGYLAPEQCLGRPVDARADVFALGVCLWEALTGRRLYKRSGDYETLNAIVHEDAPDPNERGANVPEALAAIVRRALARVPDERFQSAAELQNALERYLTDARELVTAGRIAEVVTHLAGDAREGPELDRRPAIVSWIRARADDASDLPAPAARAGGGAVARIAAGLGVACALSAMALVWSQAGETQTAAPEPVVEAAVAAPEPPPVASPPPPAIALEPVECPSGEAASAAGSSIACALPVRAVRAEPRPHRPRPRPRPGGFVDDPGF